MPRIDGYVVVRRFSHHGCVLRRWERGGRDIGVLVNAGEAFNPQLDVNVADVVLARQRLEGNAKGLVYRGLRGRMIPRLFGKARFLQ
jgi:hypothetical protein